MTEKLKELFIKYKSIIIYIIVGGLTTVVNWVVYYFNYFVLGMSYKINNPIAWAAAVIFAYFPNKYLVFENREEGRGLIQFVKFVGSRVTTLVIEQVLLWVLVEGEIVAEVYAKIVISVIVVILNYVFSKILVFGRSGKQKPEEGLEQK